MISLFSDENFMALSIRFVHTCFNNCSLPSIFCSARWKWKEISFSVHFFSNNKTHSRICSPTLKLVGSVKNDILSTLDRLRTLAESAVSRLASSMMISRYSACSSAVRSPFFNRLANPRIETIGVLNSCEKLLIKSDRSISIPANSSVIWLKQWDNFRNSFGCSK